MITRAPASIRPDFDLDREFSPDRQKQTSEAPDRPGFHYCIRGLVLAELGDDLINASFVLANSQAFAVTIQINDQQFHDATSCSRMRWIAPSISRLVSDQPRFGSLAALALCGRFSALSASRQKECDSAQRGGQEELALHRAPGGGLAQCGDLLGDRKLPPTGH